MEAVGSANDPLNSAPSRSRFRPPVRRGLIAGALATMVAIAPGVADGRDGPIPSSRAGGHETAATARTASRSGRSASHISGQKAPMRRVDPILAERLCKINRISRRESQSQPIRFTAP